MPELIRGDGGIFDVVVDGELIFSKHAVDRFPEDGEILELLESSSPARSRGNASPGPRAPRTGR